MALLQFWRYPVYCLKTAQYLTKPTGRRVAKKIRYGITRLKKLEVYLEDGRLEIDNNAAERSMKNLAVGKKNYLFAGSDSGGVRAATVYSLIETAKLNKINPQDWLAYGIRLLAPPCYFLQSATMLLMQHSSRGAIRPAD